MNNFYAYNPTKILFGKGMIARMSNELNGITKIMLVYGGGSIKKNGVYDQIKTAFGTIPFVEFYGIEPNPEYETCLRAIDLARKEGVDFILAAGGGSVIDAVKFMAMALHGTDDPWDYITKVKPAPAKAMPFGCICTLASSGSEYNNAFVISRHAQKRKISYNAINLYPRFSILDPETTVNLPWDRTAEGVSDMLIHVLEQYLTMPGIGALQDRQAEALIATIIETGGKIKVNQQDYNLRAALMWCAANAVNGMISRGVPIDWATHMIGHEITALYNIPHARTLTITLGGLYRHEIGRKKSKLEQLGQRVFGISDAEAVINKLESFFKSLDMPTRLRDLSLKADDVAPAVRRQLDVPGFVPLGEHKAITLDDVEAILRAQA